MGGFLKCIAACVMAVLTAWLMIGGPGRFGSPWVAEPGLPLVLLIPWFFWTASCWVLLSVVMAACESGRSSPMSTLPLSTAERAAAVGLRAWLPAAACVSVAAAVISLSWRVIPFTSALNMKGAPLLVAACAMLVALPVFVAAGFPIGTWTNLSPAHGPGYSKLVALVLIVIAPPVMSWGALWSLPQAIAFAVTGSAAVLFLIPRLVRAARSELARLLSAPWIGPRFSAARAEQGGSAVLRTALWTRFLGDVILLLAGTGLFAVVLSQNFLALLLGNPFVILYLCLVFAGWMNRALSAANRFPHEVYNLEWLLTKGWQGLPLTAEETARALHLGACLDACSRVIPLALLFTLSGLSTTEILAYLSLASWVLHLASRPLRSGDFLASLRPRRLTGPLRRGKSLLGDDFPSARFGIVLGLILVGGWSLEFRGVFLSGWVGPWLAVFSVALIGLAFGCRKLRSSGHLIAVSVIPALLQWNLLMHWGPEGLAFRVLALLVIVMLWLALLYRMSLDLFHRAVRDADPKRRARA